MAFRQLLQLNSILSIYHQKCQTSPMQCFVKTLKESFKIDLFHISMDIFDLLKSEKTNGFRGMKTVVLSGSTDTLIWQIITSLFWTKIVIFQQFPKASRKGNSRNHWFFNKQAGPEGPLFITRINSHFKTKTETPRFQWRGLFIDFARNIWKYPPYERFVFQVGIPGHSDTVRTVLPARTSIR